MAEESGNIPFDEIKRLAAKAMSHNVDILKALADYDSRQPVYVVTMRLPSDIIYTSKNATHDIPFHLSLEPESKGVHSQLEGPVNISTAWIDARGTVNTYRQPTETIMETIVGSI